MKKINNFLSKYIIQIVIIFLFAQPFIDVLTAVSINVLHLSITIGIVIRVLFLMLLCYYFLFVCKSKYKKQTLIYFGLLTIYFILYMIVVLVVKDQSVLLYEAQGLIRTFYFPISLVLLFHIFMEKKQTIDTKKYIIIMGIYLILIVIPNLTNTGFITYIYCAVKEGSLGWFNSANEINAILSMLLPFSVAWLLQKNDKKNKFNIIVKILYTLALLYVFFSMGTKMAIISLAFVLGVYLLILLIKLVKSKKYMIITGITVIIITGVAVSIILVPKTSFYKNIKTHLNYLGITNISEIITNPKNIDHFIFSSRLSFIGITHSNYIKTSIPEKLIGIGYLENYGTDDLRTKIIEMDPFDIFYRHGVIGFILFFIPVLYLGTKTILESRKKNQLSFYLSLVLIIFMTTFTGHVMTSPAVSLLVSVILVNQVAKMRYEE